MGRLGAFLCTLSVVFLSACHSPTVSTVSYDQLPGWKEENLDAVYPLIKHTCKDYLKFPQRFHISASDWSDLCQALTPSTPLRPFFEKYFTPVRRVSHRKGLLTAYAEPLFQGSLTHQAPYNIPLLSLPSDLLTLHLGAFSPTLEGKTLIGRLQGHSFRPYPDRASIERDTALKKRYALAWVKSPLDAFILHIQGSGVLELPNHTLQRIRFAGHNGRPYVSIGRWMLRHTHLKKASWPSLRSWFHKHPQRVQSVLNHNPHYVFFKDSQKAGPVGAFGKILTPMRSLAVDTRYIPLGLPVWVQASAPSFPRLMFAHDRGSAIHGANRGDVFFGTGKKALQKAGTFKEPGTLILLLPKKAAERLIHHE